MGTIAKAIADGDDRFLLRTPVAGEVEGGAVAPEVAKAKNQTLRLSGQMIDMVAPNQLPKLPTPNTMDYLPARNKEDIDFSKGGHRNVRETVVNELLATPVASEGLKAPAQQNSETKSKTGQVWLSNQAKDMEQLPTTTASDWKGANHSGSGSASSRGISTVVEQTNWGKFEPAIKRWEAVIGRPAPEPTKPDGKENAHRLSSRFTEWMMGVPEGWITDVGLSRNDELKACGNGVVPQQAELALKILLEGVQVELGGGR